MAGMAKKPKKDAADGEIRPDMSTAELLAAGVQVVVPFELPTSGKGITYYEDDDAEPVPDTWKPESVFARGNAAWARDAAGNEDSAAAAAAQGEDDEPDAPKP